MPTVSVELNFFYLHYNDAKTLAEWARERQNESVNPSIYARHAILSVVFAAEALINRVLVEFSSAPDVFDVLEKYSILDKWTLAPFLCAPNDSPEPFDMGKEPMQSFKELVQLRNWLAHPKVDNFFPANLDPTSTISGDLPDEEYPWLEMLKGDTWRQTKIPKNLFEITHAHAAAAVTVLDRMVDALRYRLRGQMHEGWLELIAVKDAQGLHSYRAPVGTIWGGYGGRDS